MSIDRKPGIPREIAKAGVAMFERALANGESAHLSIQSTEGGSVIIDFSATPPLASNQVRVDEIPSLNPIIQEANEQSSLHTQIPPRPQSE